MIFEQIKRTPTYVYVAYFQRSLYSILKFIFFDNS